MTAFLRLQSLASQDKARQRGVEDPDEYDMGPVIESKHEHHTN